jgi:hypothetical protein
MIQVEKLNALPFRIRKCIRTNVPLSDLEEMVIRIGVKEVRNFLRIQALVIHSNVFSLAYIILILICILCNCRDSAY